MGTRLTATQASAGLLWKGGRAPAPGSATVPVVGFCVPPERTFLAGLALCKCAVYPHFKVVPARTPGPATETVALPGAGAILLIPYPAKAASLAPHCRDEYLSLP
jgi:hypothetical protein